MTRARTAKEKPHVLTALLEERFMEVMMSEHKGTLEKYWKEMTAKQRREVSEVWRTLGKLITYVAMVLTILIGQEHPPWNL
jgi:hypothetical protein